MHVPPLSLACIVLGKSAVMLFITPTYSIFFFFCKCLSGIMLVFIFTHLNMMHLSIFLCLLCCYCFAVYLNGVLKILSLWFEVFNYFWNTLTHYLLKHFFLCSLYLLPGPSIIPFVIALQILGTLFLSPFLLFVCHLGNFH